MAMELVKKIKGGAILKDGEEIYFRIDDAIMNFPHILRKKKFEDDKSPDGHYILRILLDKSKFKEMKDELLAHGKKLASEKKLDWSKLKDDHKFLVDGDKSNYDEENGFYVVKTKETRRPTVRRKNKELLTLEDDGAEDLVYSGGHADVIIGFYAYNNQHKGVKANPKSIRLLECGEKFANSGSVDDEDAWDTDDDDNESFDDDDADL